MKNGYNYTRNGVNYSRQKHIGLGTARDPWYDSSIYFAWDLK